MYDICLSNRIFLVVKVKTLGLSMNSVCILIIVVNKEVFETETSFLMVLGIRLNNDLFYCNYNT